MDESYVVLGAIAPHGLLHRVLVHSDEFDESQGSSAYFPPDCVEARILGWVDIVSDDVESLPAVLEEVN